MTPLLKIICFLFDPNIGGPTIRARAVYEKMTEQGYDVRIAFPKGEGSAKEYFAETNIPTDHLSIAKPTTPRKLLSFLHYLLTAPINVYRVVVYLKHQKPDIVHVNGAFDIVPALGGFLADVPVVWHLNDTVFGRGFSRFLGVIVRRVASVVVIAATRVGEHYNVMSVSPHVVFAPVDINRFVPAARDDSNLFLLTMIGNWNWIKGQDRFVEVIRRLKERKVPVEAMIVGKFLESQKEYWNPIVARIAELNLEEVISTPGFKSDMVDVLKNSKLFILASHSEASPISLLEAMAMGVPAVSFDVGGVQEMLGDGPESAGIVVPEGDIGAMVSAIEFVLADPAVYQRMSEAGQKRARDHFSLESCVERHKAAYTAAISNTVHKGV